jgi:outer membrane murein-binding lipoprotein Lpp
MKAIARLVALMAVVLLAGCAAGGPSAGAKPQDCRAEVEQLKAQLAAESAERQRLARAVSTASRREETLRKQLDAMKSIERGILEREDRLSTETR